MTTEQVTNNEVATNAAPAQQPATDGANSGQSQSAKFTQEQVNELVGGARKKARESAVLDLLKELGLSSVEEVSSLKATIEDARKRKESDMTEAQKAQALAEKAIKEKSDLEIQLNAERQERRNDRIASALTSAAGKLKANDTDDVLRYARDKHGEELATLIDDSGAIDPKKVDALMEKIKASKPHYFTTPTYTPGSQSNANGRVMQQTPTFQTKIRI